MRPVSSHAICAVGCALALGSLASLSCAPRGSRAAPPAARTSPPATASANAGLLFYLSGEHGPLADYAAPGTQEPNFVQGVSTIADGAVGRGLRCDHYQLLAYWAPGNIYSQRGTLAFFWRAREAVGPTEFPIFRVAYADHSSWDMVWSRIDYNGHGFDAFVTDVSLSRTRVSVTLDPFPAPETWVHLALGWDENSGIRFYVDGKLAAANDRHGVWDAALDQFGTHSRIIGPTNVQSDYNFVRGGDVDELRIYDHALDNAAIGALARGKVVAVAGVRPRSLDDPVFAEEWQKRFGWGKPLPHFAGPNLSVRKVAIHDAYDLKRWWWKANDGIRETTWPGVYNRSRLPGRSDYFQLLDWDCYTQSGKSITFTLPDEPWNQLEIAGAAWGRMTLAGQGAEKLLFERPRGAERTTHSSAEVFRGGQLRFDNAEQEQPIAELGAYYVRAGGPPAASHQLSYQLSVTRPDEKLRPLAEFIERRYPPDERATLVAHKAETAPQQRPKDDKTLPLVHVLIPPPALATSDPHGLDGIEIALPAPSKDQSLNVRVKDPLWPLRDLLDFTFEQRSGEYKNVWLDLRDRILPSDTPLYLTLASLSATFDEYELENSRVTLFFKPDQEALREHVIDRWTGVRDGYAQLVEENPRNLKFNLWKRFKTDLEDLLRVAPDHTLARQYAALTLENAPPAPFEQPVPPAGVPLWAFRQVTALAAMRRIALYYVDQRQIENGEFGGGLSDDTDLTNLWPGLALMGVEPDKLKRSVRAVLEACYRSGMLKDGLPAAQADELHGYEEGLNALGQNLLLDFASPSLLERALESARGLQRITAVNPAGHRHFRSSYYSATRIAEDSVWGYGRAHMYLTLHPSLLLALHNGNPAVKKLTLELADGLLAHRKQSRGGYFTLPRAIHFATDRESSDGRWLFPWPLFWSAWKSSADRKYLEPILDGGTASLLAVNADAIDELDLRASWGPRILSGEKAPPTESRGTKDVRGQHRGRESRTTRSGHFLWQLSHDKRELEKLYADVIQELWLREYSYTEGSIWIDRVAVNPSELQRARLGGIALVRNHYYPGHTVSWAFAAPATAESVAILLPRATPTEFVAVLYNLEQQPVKATLTAWNIEPGRWQVEQGTDSNDDDRADRNLRRSTQELERGQSLTFDLPPRVQTVLHFKLQARGKPYWSRPDLGIELSDVQPGAGKVDIVVHNLGSVDTPQADLVLTSAGGRKLSARIPRTRAPLDLLPKTTVVTLPLPAGFELQGATLAIDPQHRLQQITRVNDVVRLP